MYVYVLCIIYLQYKIVANTSCFSCACNKDGWNQGQTYMRNEMSFKKMY